MLRTGLVLLLLCAAAPALATQSTTAHLAHGAAIDCDTSDAGGGADTGTTAGSKAKPLLAPATNGGDADDVLPRTRGPKWHRLLPGMFR